MAEYNVEFNYTWDGRSWHEGVCEFTTFTSLDDARWGLAYEVADTLAILGGGFDPSDVYHQMLSYLCATAGVGVMVSVPTRDGIVYHRIMEVS